MARRSGREHIALLQMYLWCKSAVVVDEFHPMMSGFVRLKPRRDRRPGSPVDGRLRHLSLRVPQLYRMMTGYAGVLRELRDVWAETTATADVADAAGLGALRSLRLWRGFLGSMFGAVSDAATPGRDGAPTRAEGTSPGAFAAARPDRQSVQELGPRS